MEILQSDILDTIKNDDEIMEGCTPLHKAAMQHNFLEEIPIVSKTKLTPQELEELIHLEKIMDLHVLEARMRDENKNFTCNLRGNLSKTNKRAIEQEKRKLKKKWWIDFPMVDMVNGFGVHWYYKQSKKECKINSFAMRDAVHYALNNVTMSYDKYRELDGDYGELVEEEAGIKKKNKYLEGDYIEVYDDCEVDIGGKMTNIKGQYGKFLKYKRNKCTIMLIDPPTIVRNGVNVCLSDVIDVNPSCLRVVEKHWVLDQAYYGNNRIRNKFNEMLQGWNDETAFQFKDYEEEMNDRYTGIRWSSKLVSSTFGEEIVSETLSFDQRLLSKKTLDVPMICIPSIFRQGEADFHCLYFEGHNAMGQLEDKKMDFATIVIVREDEKEEYAKRYYSDHTFFVALDVRERYEIKGYSAGDSKFYCYRIAEYLYDLWKTPKMQGKRRVLIMDDQMQPFTHQIPIFKKNDKSVKAASLEPKKETFLDDGTTIEADTYKFRSELKDEQNVSMMYRGNSRFVITHAAYLMYLNKIADITGAGLVCASGDEAESTNMPLRTAPYKNIAWLFDTEVVNAPPIHPAYQAAEDMMMSRVLFSRGVRVVTANTMRWRKSVTGGGTCGRNQSGPKPFTPIIKYHELAKVCSFENEPSLREGPYDGKESVVIKDAGYPFKNFTLFYRKREDKIDTEAIQFDIDNWGTAHVVVRLKFGLTVAGSATRWSHPYGSRHIITMLSIYMLKLIEKEMFNTKKKPTVRRKFSDEELVEAKWVDGKWYSGTILRYDKQQKKYVVMFEDGQWDYIATKDIRSQMDALTMGIRRLGTRLKF